jgi:hypothetical protein
VVYHEREVYSLLDFLSDIGGLKDILSLLGQAVLYMLGPICTFSSISQGLAKQLFWLETARPLKPET